MEDIKHEMKNMARYWFQESDVQIVSRYMYTYFLKLLHVLRKLKNVFVSALVKNNQVRQFVKFIILSTSHTYVLDLSRPGSRPRGVLEYI